MVAGDDAKSLHLAQNLTSASAPLPPNTMLSIAAGMGMAFFIASQLVPQHCVWGKGGEQMLKLVLRRVVRAAKPDSTQSHAATPSATSHHLPPAESVGRGNCTAAAKRIATASLQRTKTVTGVEKSW